MDTAAIPVHSPTSGGVQLHGPSETAPSHQESTHAVHTFNPRKKFRELFKQDHWNRPDTKYDDMDKELTEKRALVVVIRYGVPYLLLGTLADAYKITDMLENQFQYPPKCICMLMDQPKKGQTLSPTRDNVIEGLKWLGEDYADGSKRVFYFAGHGCTPDPKNRANESEGIIPVDSAWLLPEEPSDESDAPDESGALTAGSNKVLFDWELNQHIVGALPNSRVKLTVAIDSCYSGGLSAFIPESEDMSNTRGRRLFVLRGGPAGPENIGTAEVYAPGFGNVLDLPIEVDLADTDTPRPSEQGTRDDRGQRVFKPFPPLCEVISWFACRNTQKSGEDKNGGYFTTAFTGGVKQHNAQLGPDRQTGKCTYRDLNRYILDEFKKRNEKRHSGQVVGGNSGEVIDEGDTVAQTHLEYQTPKLYVSENIAGHFADTEVDI